MRDEYELGEVIAFEDPDVPGQETGVIMQIDGDDITVAVDGEWSPREVMIDRNWIV